MNLQYYHFPIYSIQHYLGFFPKLVHDIPFSHAENHVSASSKTIDLLGFPDLGAKSIDPPPCIQNPLCKISNVEAPLTSNSPLFTMTPG